MSYFLIFANKKSTTSKEKDQVVVKKNSEKEETAPLKEKATPIEEKYQVDIKGEVNTPGIYSLEKKSRVIDVINAAGGLTSNANTTVINLSKKITDEMVIIIYSNDEVANFKKTKEVEAEVLNKCQQPDENAIKNDACICSDTKLETLISLNNATKEELTKLPGIGEAKAEDIIAYRKENGPFEKIEDIKNISGIGESLFAKIKDYLTL